MPENKPPIRDLTQYGSDMEFFPPKDKNALWLAQYIFYSKLNNVVFVDPKKYEDYRLIDRMTINKRVYIEMLDPKTPSGQGGTAEYIAADMEEIPVAQHLDNILRAKLDRLGVDNDLQCTEIDKYAKMQRQREKDRILYEREFRSLINEANKASGYPPIKESQSPYNYVKTLKGEQGGDVNENLIDYIRSQIQDSQDMTLFMTYVYRGDIEKAFELALKHYLINMNKWPVEAQAFNNDLKNVNAACGRWYTDETSGRGTVEYLYPTSLYTNPFVSYNGEDITRWYYEKDISFADFVRMFGQTLDDRQLKEVFELNKNNGGCHGMSWGSAKGVKGSNAKIRIGFMSCLTQDAEKFAEKYVGGKIKSMERKPLSWLPHKNTPNKYKERLKTKMYNVWYSCYYIPPPGTRLSKNSAADWAWQAQYIFNIHKDIDMYRYGTDLRYAKSTLVVWRDPRPSFMDIKEAYMPKMRNAWHLFQNCIINDIDAVGLAEDFINAAVGAVDEANKRQLNSPDNPSGGAVDAKLVAMKQLKQSGLAFLKMTDSHGQPLIDPSKMMIRVQNGMLEKAERYLNIILQLYQLMTTSLAQNDISEGQDPKPRTAVAGIQAAMAASEKGTWFIENGAREFLIQYGERCVQYILYILKEHKVYKHDERWEELSNVIGVANAMAIESIEDYNPEDIALTVTLEDVQAMKKFYVDLTQMMLKDGKISDEDVEMVTSAILQNYKYGATLLTISTKKIKREQAKQQELLHQQKMEELDMQLKISMALNQAKGQAKDKNIMTQGDVDAKINSMIAQMKDQSMKEQSDLRTKNRMAENEQKEKLKRDTEAEKPTELVEVPNEPE